jgi:hypothetical protein
MPGLNDPAIQDNPFEYYRERTEHCPVWREDERDLYVIAGHEEGKAALLDVATFSNRPSGTRGRGDEAAAAYHRVLEERGWTRTPTLQRTDPPTHTRYRKCLHAGAGPRADPAHGRDRAGSRRRLHRHRHL